MGNDVDRLINDLVSPAAAPTYVIAPPPPLCPECGHAPEFQAVAFETLVNPRPGCSRGKACGCKQCCPHPQELAAWHGRIQDALDWLHSQGTQQALIFSAAVGPPYRAPGPAWLYDDQDAEWIEIVGAPLLEADPEPPSHVVHDPR